MKKIRRALISVFDKSDLLLSLVQILAQNGVEFLSTGRTASYLTEAGFEVREVSDYTGFPEILNGRVKTLHPKSTEVYSRFKTIRNTLHRPLHMALNL